MSKRALANQQTHYRTMRLSRFGRSMIMLFATVLSFAVLTLLVTDHLMRPESFVIKQLKLKGQFKKIQPQQVEQVVYAHKPGNFFAVNLSEIKTAIEALDWVYSADVRREWPDILSIHILEQSPVAKWGKNQWLNNYGDVIDIKNVHLNKGAVQLHGAEKDSVTLLHQAKAWQLALQQKGLLLKSATLSDSQAWTLKLVPVGQQKAFELKLGSQSTDARFARFLFMYESQFAEQPQQLLNVDARYPNGLAVKAQAIEDISQSMVSKI